MALRGRSRGHRRAELDLYKRIKDDAAFDEFLKTLLFDQYLRGHQDAEELIAGPLDGRIAVSGLPI